MKISEIMKSVGDQENKFLNSTFLAPIFRNGNICTRAAGFTVILKVPRSKVEWAIIRPTSLKTARIIREAKRFEILEYLEHLPKVSFILTKRRGDLSLEERRTQEIRWFGFPAFSYHSVLGDLHPLDLRQINYAVGSQFERILAGYDGRNFWYASPDFSRHPYLAEELRLALKDQIPPDKIKLHTSSTTPQERKVYRIAFELEKEPIEKLLERSVAHGGGDFGSFVDQGESYLVRFTIDGELVNASVKKNLQVISAGFCLDDRDADFDLTSLVSVVREKKREDDYRDYDD